MTDANLEPRRGLTDAYELYRLLEKQELLRSKPPMWWPAYGSFEVVVGAILTQNSQWTRVEVSLENLRSKGCLELETICKLDTQELEELIAPSGLFKSKAKYLQLLSHAIKDAFGNFDTFSRDVDRKWLLQQKGIGPETADSILCYACKRDAMVVDAYTARLLDAFGCEFDCYDALQSWCMEGLSVHFNEDEHAKIYALFHGMIVEYVKANSKGKKVNIVPLKTKE